MKKKRNNQTLSTIADTDMESLIHSHREFFDHLIELIPSKFYLSNDDADSKPWYQGLSKSAKASLKQQSKQNLKLARRERFDPDKKPTINLLEEQQITKTPLPEGSNLMENSKENPSVTYEELRQKLRRKIELLRGNRGGASGEQKNEYKNVGNKRKRDVEDSVKGVDLNDDDDDAEEIIEYGKVKLGDEDEEKYSKNKKGKLSKSKELEKAKKLQEVKKDKPDVTERESWKAATSRAMGVKVHDDARLIKESIKKEKKKKEKNAQKWKERVETQEKMKEQRQQKRKDNIDGRIKENKMRKIAKREKKLMRPGFEGRKDSFITKD